MISRIFAALAAAALVSGCVGTGGPRAPAAEALPPTERLASAIEESGCLLTADNVDSILLRANMTSGELERIVPELNAAGRVEVSGGGAIRLLSDRCI